MDYLNGAPGIYSARYAGEHASDGDNLNKLLMAMQDVPDDQRSARFHCVLVLMRHADDPTPIVCHGKWEGKILTAPHGSNGFGYDPIFWVPEENCASAELEPVRKSSYPIAAKPCKNCSKRLKSSVHANASIA